MDEQLTEQRDTSDESGAQTPTDSELKELREKAAKADQYYDALLRAKADLENFRKRAARERDEIMQRANENLLEELLGALDNFELGLQSARESQNRESIIEGMEMVQKQFASFLQKLGVETIDAVGQEFDPSLHEAIAQQQSDKPAGKIIAQTRRGFRLKGHLLRPAAVVVSKGPAA